MAYQFTQTGAELQDLIDRIYQIAEEYDPGTSYVIGDYCSYGGKIYRCTAATTGTFAPSKWTDSVIVMDAVKSLKGRMDTAESDIDALETGKQDTLSSSFQTLATDAELASYGKVRTLILRDYVPTSASFFSIPSGNRPHINSFALGRYYSGSTYYPCLVTISTTGAVSASYFNGSTASAISSGKVIAAAAWIVA